MEAAAAAAAVGVVEMKADMVVVVGETETASVVSRVELKVAAAGIGEADSAETVPVVSRAELKAAAAAGGIEATKTAAVAGVLLDILRPHAGTGDTGHERSATGCVAQRVVAGVIGVGEFGFVAIRGTEEDLQVGNTVSQTDTS